MDVSSANNWWCFLLVNTEIQHYNATFELPQNEIELEQVFKAYRLIYNEGLVQDRH